MSYKSTMNNSIKSNNCDSNHWARAPSTDMNVKFAGEEAKDRMYEPKEKQKLVRVLTVIAYIFFVSLAAIMLSLYYVFIWKGSQKDYYRPRTFVVTLPSKCPQSTAAVLTQAPESAIVEQFKDTPTPFIEEYPVDENNSDVPSLFPKFLELSKRSVFFNKFFKIRQRDKIKDT